MPLKSDKHAIKCPFLDKRTKLLPCQKEMVLYWFERGQTIAQLSKSYKVSKRLIQFIVDPESKRKNIEKRDQRGGPMQYFNRKAHAAAMRRYRQHKKDIYNGSNPKGGLSK